MIRKKLYLVLLVLSGWQHILPADTAPQLPAPTAAAPAPAPATWGALANAVIKQNAAAPVAAAQPEAPAVATPVPQPTSAAPEAKAPVQPIPAPEAAQKPAPEPIAPIAPAKSEPETTAVAAPAAPQAEATQAPVKPAEEPLKPAIAPKTDKDAEQAKLEQHLRLLEDKTNIVLNLNHASLQNFADQIAELFGYTFLSDDDIKAPDQQQQQPQQPGGWSPAPTQPQRTNRPLADTKISFRTNAPLSKRRAWNLFTTFLEMSGWALAPTTDQTVWRITSIPSANKRPLPTFIDTPVETLPDSDQRVRYIFFLQNSSPKMMEGLINALKSPNAMIESFTPAKALILTDAAYNIRSLVRIMQELDKSTSPQTISIIKLDDADAVEAAKVISDFQKKDEPSPFFSPKKEGGSSYFSSDVTIIPDPRTNTLIMVGPQDAVSRVESFVKTKLDVKDTSVQSPIRTYQLDYVPAGQLADLLNSVLSFGSETGVGKAGGVRAGVKYFSGVTVQAETQTNQLMIRANKEDFEHLSRFIRDIDKRQPQVALEVMIFSIDINATRQWGMQWNSKKQRMFNAQMSGFFDQGIQVSQLVPPSTIKSIITDLIGLANVPGAGTTLMTLGKDMVYAIMGVLSTNNLSRLLTNPFVLTTNKYRAIVASSEQRQAQNQNIINAGAGAAGYGTFNAMLEVGITPQINSTGIINLDVDIKIESFLNPADATASFQNADKLSNTIHTNANVADREVLAIGGLIKKKNTLARDRIPFLSKIPIVGSFFRNEQQVDSNQHLLIFITPTIIRPGKEDVAESYTRNKAKYFTDVNDELDKTHDVGRKDPIYRWFFQRAGKDATQEIRDFVMRPHKESKQATEASSAAAPIEPKQARTSARQSRGALSSAVAAETEATA